MQPKEITATLTNYISQHSQLHICKVLAIDSCVAAHVASVILTYDIRSMFNAIPF